MRANDSFQKFVQAFNQPLQEILGSIRYLLHVPRSDLGKNDQAQGHDPAHHHGVGDGETEGAGDLVRLWREDVFLLLGGCRRCTLLFGIGLTGHSAG